MKNRNIFIIVVIVLIAAGLLSWKLGSKPPVPISGIPFPGTSTTTSPTGTSNFDQSISDAIITVGYSKDEFGLATNPSQILAKSYIPSCNEGFNYCLYYTGKAYEGTNFESAGIRIQKRTDLGNERVCLNTPPSGFDATKVPDNTNPTNDFSTSIFSNVGDAAAGHYSSGSLYRLFVRKDSSCYEFETRIGQSQFQNYPAGSIKEFTTSDAQNLEAKLNATIDHISLSSAQKVIFPHAPKIEQQIANCGAFPNGSTEHVTNGSRLFITIPKSIYPDVNVKIIPRGVTTRYAYKRRIWQRDWSPRKSKLLDILF
jgi:hypothetical protein